MLARLHLEPLERRIAPATGPVQQVAPIAVPVTIVPDPSVPPDARETGAGETVTVAQVEVFVDLPGSPLPEADFRIGRFAETPYFQTPPATPASTTPPVELPSLPMPPDELVWMTPEERAIDVA